jgi:hypothetical protein
MRPRRQWRTCQRSAKRAVTRLRCGALEPALRPGQRDTLCAALTLWSVAGCPRTFAPVAERVAGVSGRNERTTRRHLTRLAELGLLAVVEHAVPPVYCPAPEGGWRRVRAGRATVYEPNFAALALQHMGSRHRRRPALDVGVSTDVGSTTTAGESTSRCSRTNLGGHFEDAPIAEPTASLPIESGPGPPGLRWAGNRWVSAFPMTEGG